MSEHMTTSTIDRDEKTDVRVLETVSGPGGGNPDATISYNGYEQEKPELAQALIEIINSGECMVRCTHEDDGCVDGRCVCEIAYPDGEDFATVEVQDNGDHERAKIAGGGYITGLAMLQALGEHGDSPEQDITYVADELAKQKVFCGGHVGSHGKFDQGQTDCGANDKENIIVSGSAYDAESPAGGVSLLMKFSADGYDQKAIETAFGGWAETIGNTGYFSGSNGVTRLEAAQNAILKAEKDNGSDKKASVIKNLGASHNEKRLVVTYEKGHTFSQTKLRHLLMERFPAVDPNELPQVFVCDFWRVQELAQAVARFSDKSTGMQQSDEDARKRYKLSLHAGVAFQVATYLTLTDGTLPIDFVGAAR